MTGLIRLISHIALSTCLASAAFGYELANKQPPTNISENLKALKAISQGITELASQASKSIVFVSISKNIPSSRYGQIDPFEFFFGPQYRQQRPERKQSGLGSGFIVDLDKGYIITNNHVIEGADELKLKLANGKTYNGKVLGRDKNTDVAVVEVQDSDFDRSGLTQLHLGDSDQMKVGEFVVALGAPFGLESSLSFGVISARDRVDLNITEIGNFIQTDAAINPGNSGGPLINTEGQVIGMNTAIYSRSGSSAGIGFAVPSNIVRRTANQLINKGSVDRGYLGIQMAELDSDMAQALGLPKKTEGTLINYVEPGTPAARAGLQDADVITAINNRKVRKPAELRSLIGLKPAGTKVKITYFRNGKTQTTTATLGNYPSDNRLAQQAGQGKKSLFGGLKLVALSKKNVKRLSNRYDFISTSGIVISEVARNSQAAAAGLMPGDVILKLNRKTVNNIKQFRKIYNNKKSKLLVQIERKGTFFFTSLKK